MVVLRRSALGPALVLAALSAGCGDAQPGAGTPSGAGGGAASGAAGAGGAAAGTGGMVAAGESGLGGQVAAGGGSGGGGSGNAGSGGSGGSGGEVIVPPACNELELIPVGAVCTAVASGKVASGGELPSGVYTLVSYETLQCGFALEQTLRLEEQGDMTFHMDMVVNVENLHASGTFVTSDLELVSTLDCGAFEEDAHYGYSVREEAGEIFLDLYQPRGLYTYQRVGD